MTELERARAHLRECQKSLAHYRLSVTRVESLGPPLEYPRGRFTDNYESNVLAALSWLWEAQANEALHNAEICTYPGHMHRMHEMFGSDLARLALPS